MSCDITESLRLQQSKRDGNVESIIKGWFSLSNPFIVSAPMSNIFIYFI